MEGIFDALKHQALIHTPGGGVFVQREGCASRENCGCSPCAI
jgi:hypothetical protein